MKKMLFIERVYKMQLYSRMFPDFYFEFNIPEEGETILPPHIAC